MDGVFVKTAGLTQGGGTGAVPLTQLMEDPDLLRDIAEDRLAKIGTNIIGIEGKLEDGKCPEDMKRLLRYNLTGLRRAKERYEGIVFDSR